MTELERLQAEIEAAKEKLRETSEKLLRYLAGKPLPVVRDD